METGQPVFFVKITGRCGFNISNIVSVFPYNWGITK